MRIAIAQLNQVLGDLAGNARALLDADRRRAARRRARSSSRPSCRCAAIRPRTCCCGRHSSTPARAELAALAARSAGRRRRSSAFPSATTAARYNALAVLRDGRVAAGLSQAAPAELHGVRRGALFRAGRRDPCVFDVDGVRVRRRSSARTSGFPGRPRRRRRRARELLVVPNGSPYHTQQQALRARAGRARARARPACRSSTSIASAARTSSCSTARRSSSTPTARSRSSFPAWHETIALVAFDGAIAAARCAARSTTRSSRTSTRRW